ncbi:hypothetical protein BG004_005519 [Podila humilis]|nr:hypothetical protein BG004_005519 [Podila humilis]
MFWQQLRESMSIKTGKSVTRKGLVDAATNDLPKAIQNKNGALATRFDQPRGVDEVGDDDIGDYEGESERFDGELDYDEGD